jgi:glucosamine--fructose-6-phosphate aminotransferase (isomerizing)
VDVIAAGVEAPGVTRAADACPRIPRCSRCSSAQSFYRLANAVAIARGFDPDSPPHLRKVTETL